MKSYISSFSFQSVIKTGRVLIAHEAPITMGFGAELASSIQVRRKSKRQKERERGRSESIRKGQRE